MPDIPKFSDLPLNKGDPRWSAWGLYGKDDQLGTLNRLTDDVVKAASSEIRTGTRISLNWPLDAQKDIPFFNRQAFHKNVFQKLPRIVNDDEWSFNTQSSSQWDGLRHFGYQKEEKFYNGVTLDDIHGENKTNVNGIGAWSEKGIVGRGVLLDFHGWREAKGLPYDAFESGSISLEQLKEVAKSQDVELRFGDILIIRSGYMVAYGKLPREEIKSLMAVQPHHFSGVEQSEKMLEWIWNNFSAVAGDQPSFECWPTQKNFALHEILLAGWGCPIGELFDLEALSEHCKKVNRYTFFVTSEVCNVPGGVASPPNILAIF
ncbi:hypothetical protein K402DRAFT_376071 [Aulographum hederae CBS 113979]|uniref:Cyclase n=1 Tax=Aulographum hederae CBS 113979 TaxID=1176131 RepID=A0A6G1H2Q2_9PEZI|nr:hypothetical protein K402DRAFT_376071 [Aulographum hederae CBS 113979]